MPVVTWKNIAPTSGSGILDAINTAGRQIGTGIAGVGDAFTDYADKRSQRETDELVAALHMATGNGTEAGEEQAKRDRVAIMQSINPNESFADLNTVAEAFKESNAMSEFELFKKKEAIKQKNKMAQIYAEGSNKNKKNKKDYSLGNLEDVFTSKTGQEDANEVPLWGFANIWGETTPVEDVRNRLGKFFNDAGMSADEQKRAAKVISDNLIFDRTGFNEYFINDGKMGTTIDDSTDLQLRQLLEIGGYKTDKEIEDEKKKYTNANTK